MEIKINAFIPRQSGHQWVEVFGYQTKSQPGLEITGINGKGRLIKEKLTFLSKKRRLKFPLKRFVLCVDGHSLDKADVDYLELPLLLGFWCMADILPLKRLDNCFTSGKVSLEGEVNLLSLSPPVWRALDDNLGKKERSAIYLGPETLAGPEPLHHIHFLSPVEFLNDSVGGFSYMESALASSTK